MSDHYIVLISSLKVYNNTFIRQPDTLVSNMIIIFCVTKNIYNKTYPARASFLALWSLMLDVAASASSLSGHLERSAFLYSDNTAATPAAPPLAYLVQGGDF